MRGSVVCVRDIALTDPAPVRREPAQRGAESRTDAALDASGLIPTRARRERRAEMGRDSLAEALRSYCEDGHD